MQLPVLILVVGLAVHAQTLLAPDQVVNLEQVRIYPGDGTAPGTRVLASQISDGRFVYSPDAWTFAQTAYGTANVIPVCIVQWFAVGDEFGNVSINRMVGCFTLESLPGLKADPYWAPWLASHGF